MKSKPGVLAARFFACLASLVVASQIAHAAEPMTVMLDWVANPTHAPLLVAQYSGDFAKEGLDVKLVEPSDPSSPPRLVSAGQAALAVSFQPDLYLMAEQGLPLVRVGTLIDTPLNTLTTLPGRGVKTLADLKGKTVGYSIEGVEPAEISAMLKSAGVDPKDVKLVNVNFQIVSALLSNQVAAGTSVFRTYELNEVKQKVPDPIVFNPEQHGVPTYDELIYIANRNEKNDPRLPKFFHAVAEATAYLEAHPDDAWNLVIKNRPDFNTPLNRLAWRQNLSRFPASPTALDRDRYLRFQDFLFKYDVIKKKSDIDAIAVQLH